MAAEIDDSMAQEKVYKMMVDKKEAKKAIKAKNAVELQRTKKMDVSDDEILDNEDIQAKRAAEKKVDAGVATGADSSENDDDLDEEREIQRIMKE